MSLTYRYLSIPFNNPFEDLRVSHEDFAQFGEEVWGSLRVNRDRLGISQEQADSYQNAKLAFQALMGDENIAFANRKAASLELKLTWQMVVNEVRRKEAWVRSKYARESAEYVTLFPQGLKPYQQTRRGDQMTLLHVLVTCFGQFESDFPGAASSFAALKATFEEVEGRQADKKGTLSGRKHTRKQARKVLADHLHGLWLSVAQAHAGNPGMAKVLFNVSIFNKGTNYDNDKLGRLILQVDDPEGRPVADAKVEVRTLENQMVQKGRTKTDGRYKGRKLGIGFYEVTVRQVGKATFKARYQIFDDQDPVREVKMEE